MRTLMILAGLVLAGAAQADVTIDLFEQGGFSFSGGVGPNNETQTGLFPLLTIGGQRIVLIEALVPGETVTAELVLSAGDDAVAFASDSSGGSFSLGYGDFGMPTLDLTDGGTVDRIEVVVTQAAVSGTLDLLALDASSGNGSLMQPLSGPGTYSFSLADLPGVDFSAIQLLQVEVQATTNGRVEITEVSARSAAMVPALALPGVAALVTLLLASSTAVLRRRRRG